MKAQMDPVVSSDFQYLNQRTVQGEVEAVALYQDLNQCLIIQVRETTFREMKKDVGMTTAQKSKETRRMEMGSIFVL